MSIVDATQTVVNFVRDTSKPISQAIKEVWPSISEFSEDEQQTLLQEAIAHRVNPLLTRGVTVTVTDYHRVSMERHEVTCQLLHDVVYHVNGVAKPVALFTKFDVVTKLESVRRVEEGLVRHRKMWEYVHERLAKFKKGSVEELAEGEQIKIARMVYDLRVGKYALPMKLL